MFVHTMMYRHEGFNKSSIGMSFKHVGRMTECSSLHSKLVGQQGSGTGSSKWPSISPPSVISSSFSSSSSSSFIFSSASFSSSERKTVF